MNSHEEILSALTALRHFYSIDMKSCFTTAIIGGLCAGALISGEDWGEANSFFDPPFLLRLPSLLFPSP